MASVFRKSAMERLTSPDRLDTMIKVTTPLSWMGILAAFVLSAGVIAWSFIGKIPTTASVTGFFVSGYNTNTIFCTGAGYVSEILVKEGDSVTEKTPVAELIDATGKKIIIKANQRGVISSVLFEKDSVLTVNNELFRLSPETDSDMVVVCYVGLDLAKQLSLGMKTLIYPDSGDFGHVEGTITNIDQYVASVNAIGDLLGTDGQMASLLTQNGPVVAVTCVLDTESAIQNESYSIEKSGLNSIIKNGEDAAVQIILDESSPVSRIFPMLGR